MYVVDVSLGNRSKQAAVNTDVVVVSVDGVHAHLIVEHTALGLTVHEPSDPDFEEQAVSYGFRAPMVTKL